MLMNNIHNLKTYPSYPFMSSVYMWQKLKLLQQTQLPLGQMSSQDTCRVKTTEISDLVFH